MTDPVKRRRYHSPTRNAAADATRSAILAAARELFVQRGYLRTTVAQIAERAGVHLDTLYATTGRKPELMRLVIESAISGVDHAVPAERRDYVREVRRASTAERKIEIYATAVAEMGPRTAPVFEALQMAGQTDAACAALHREITERRAQNMRLFAHELRRSGALREDLSDDDVADIVWSMNAAEYYLLLVRDRGWTPQRFGRHLREAWCRMLLTPS